MAERLSLEERMAGPKLLPSDVTQYAAWAAGYAEGAAMGSTMAYEALMRELGGHAGVPLRSDSLLECFRDEYERETFMLLVNSTEVESLLTEAVTRSDVRDVLYRVANSAFRTARVNCETPEEDSP